MAIGSGLCQFNTMPIKWASGTDCGTSTSATGCWITDGSVTAYPSAWSVNYELLRDVMSKIGPGKRQVELPDGAKLIVDDLGNYRIEDKDAKVTYQANKIREFSPHLNASDMVAKFVEYVGKLGVKQSEVLGLPLELFINWLVIEAAERYQDPVPEGVVPVADHPKLIEMRKPKCLSCGRFVPVRHHRHRFPFCDPVHAGRWISKHQPARLSHNPVSHDQENSFAFSSRS